MTGDSLGISGSSLATDPVGGGARADPPRPSYSQGVSTKPTGSTSTCPRNPPPTRGSWPRLPAAAAAVGGGPFLSYSGSGLVMHRSAFAASALRGGGARASPGRIVWPEARAFQSVPPRSSPRGCHLERPEESTFPAEQLPRRAVEHLSKSLGALLIEGGRGCAWGRREEPGVRAASRPLPLKSWMASRIPFAPRSPGVPG